MMSTMSSAAARSLTVTRTGGIVAMAQSKRFRRMQGRRPHVRGRRRDRPKAEPLEDRAAVVGRVDLEIAAAVLGREPPAERDERAVDAAPAPGRERAPAPERPECRTRRKADPAGRDDGVARLGDDDAELLRIGGPLELEIVGARGTAVTPNLCLHRLDPLE